MQEIEIIRENGARNGVLDCPESRNEEKFLNIKQMVSSRYATPYWSHCRGTRGIKVLKIPPVFVAVRDGPFDPRRGTRRVWRWKNLILLSDFHAKEDFSLLLELFRLPSEEYDQNTIKTPS